MEKDLKYWIWLSSLRGVTPGVRCRLLEHFKSPRNIWHASKQELEMVYYVID